MKVTLVLQTAPWMSAARGWFWTAEGSLAQAGDINTEERTSWRSQHLRTAPSKSEQTSALPLILGPLRFEPLKI